MDITYRIDKDILYIGIEGRIDASNAVTEGECILNIINANSGKHTVIDADKFDGEGMYAYHLHIPQRDMMSKASPLDGSPVSFLAFTKSSMPEPFKP